MPSRTSPPAPVSPAPGSPAPGGDSISLPPTSFPAGTLPAIMRLAWQDMRDEWAVSACLVLSLAAVLAPLLVLFGLKYGIVSTMQQQLLNDPRNLEVTLVGSRRLGPEWFAALQADPRAAFVVPRTRSLAATMDLKGSENRFLPAVEMVPTAAGDPLVPAGEPVPAAWDHILLSQPAARTLGVAAGDPLTAILARTVDGQRQTMPLSLTIDAVLPESAFGRDALFVTNALLTATEDYRDGFGVPLFQASGMPPASGPRSYASARLFARGLDDVAPLAAQLRDQGLEIRTRAAEIEIVRATDRVLGFIFAVIAVISVTGYSLSLSASLWANIDRKHRELALLRLTGFPARAVTFFPLFQGVVVALAGSALSLLAYGVVSAMFNAVLLHGGLAGNGFVCRLPLPYATAAVAGTVLVVLVASATGGYRASRIDPAACLREL